MMKMTQFCSARRILAFACLSSALIAGSAVSTLAHAALNFRVYSSLPADDSSAHYIWFSRFQENPTCYNFAGGEALSVARCSLANVTYSSA